MIVHQVYVFSAALACLGVVLRHLGVVLGAPQRLAHLAAHGGATQSAVIVVVGLVLKVFS